METIKLSQANQAALQKQQIVTNPQVNPKPEQKKNGKKMLAIGAAAAAALAIAGIAIYKGKAKKAQKIAEQKILNAKNAEFMDDVFKNTKCFTDPLSKNGTKLTTEELFSKYLHDYSTDDITFYHGTTGNAANSIQKNGFEKGWRGHRTGNFEGVFLSPQKDVATKYAKMRADLPNSKDTGAILNVKVPNGKLAQFTNDEGKFLSYDLLKDLFEDGELGKELSKNSLDKSDFTEFLEEKIVKMGYDGVRSYDLHSGGATPIIFNPSKIEIKEIVKI